MAYEGFAGGLASGFSNMFNSQQKNILAQRAQEQQQQIQLSGQVNGALNNLYSTAAAIAKSAADAGQPVPASAIKALADQASELSQNAVRHGILSPDIAATVGPRIQALSGLTPLQDNATPKVIKATGITGDSLFLQEGTKLTPLDMNTGQPITGGEPARPGQTNLTGPNTTSTVVSTQDIPPGAPAVASSVPTPTIAQQTPSFADRFGAVNTPAPSQVPVKTPGEPLADSYGVVNYSNNTYVRQAIQNGTTDWKQLDAEATRYNMGDNSVVTAYGRASKGPMAIQRGAVIARGNDLMIAQGMKPGEVAGARAKNKALDKSLSDATAMKTAVQAFSESESKNLDVLGQLATKVDSTGVPAFERWIRAGRQATGDPDVAQFNFQYQLVKAGIARIVTQPTLKGILSDDARREIEDGFPGSSNVKQIMSIIGLAKGDFRRRDDALDETIANLQSQFRGLGLPQGDTRQLTAPGLLSSIGRRDNAAGGLAPAAPPVQNQNIFITPGGSKFKILGQ